MPLRNGAALRLTTAIYYTPNGRSIQAKGIEPDIVVARQRPEEQEKESARSKVIREEDLKNHMDTEGKTPSNKTPEAAQQDEIKEQLEKDNQLARALEVLKSWEILSRIKYTNE
jgi:carboxyl-terminal processing protease